MKLTKKILSLFLACLMVFSTMPVAQAAVVDTVSTQISSKTETVDVSKSNSLLDSIDGLSLNAMFERVSSTLENIEIKNPFTAIKTLDFDTTKISANLAKQLDEGESDFERLIAAVKVGINNAKLYVNNFITLSSEVISQAEEAGSSEVEYGVSSTYTATIPGYILATAPGDDLNVYTVTAENVVIPLKTELAVTILKDGQMYHQEDDSIIIDYNMYKVSDAEDDADSVVKNGGDRLFKVPAGFTEGTSADIYATVENEFYYAGVYEEETVVFSLKVTDTSYTEEDVTNLMYKIGKTQPEYVLAEFSEDFTSVNIFANGEFSDGLMMDWTEADESNPFYAHRDTLETVTFTGVYTTLKSIGANTFNGCEKLSCEVVLPDTLESIGENAFKGCSSITGEIVISASVTTLGNSAFEGCSSITAISTENAETSNVSTFSLKRSVSLTPEKPPINESASLVIGERAFYGCTSAQSLNIGDTVITIGGSAFENCSALTEVNTGASCTTIENYAFKDCSSVERFVLPSVEEIRYTAPFQNAGIDGTTIILQATRLGSSFEDELPTNANVIIGKTVEVVDNCAFRRGCVQSITFEDGSSLKTVGNQSFYDVGADANIETLIQGLDTTNIETIGNSAFAYNANLIMTEMCLDNMISIGDYAFVDCSGITLEEIYVPSQIETIGAYAFGDNNANLQNATISSLVFDNDCETQIGSYAFGCAYIRNVDFGTSQLTLNSYSFYGNHIENLVVPNTFKYINSYVFGCFDCEDENCLKTISFTKINGCESVPETTSKVALSSKVTERVTFEWVRTDTKSTYSSLVSFPAIEVDIADSSPDCTIVYDVKTIENASYDIDSEIYLGGTYTSNIKHLVFTDSVEVVGTGVTYDKYKEVTGGNFPLANFESITFGDNVKKIGAGAFSLGYINSYKNNTNQEYVSPDLSKCDIVIPDSVEYIGAEAFWAGGYSTYNSWYGTRYYTETDSTWKSLSLGSGVKEIDDRAFYRMSNATGDVVVGNNCLVVGDSAFFGGASFNSISLGCNLRKIGEKAFYGCSNATGDIVVSDFVGEHSDDNGDGLCDACEVVVEQDILPGETISFEVGNDNAQSIEFIPSLTSVYTFDFDLQVASEINVSIHDENETQIISKYMTEDVFTEYGDNVITSTLEAGVKYTIEVNVPENSDEETIVVMSFDGEKYTSHNLGRYAFYGCSNLTSLEFGERLTQVPYACFQGCSSLRTIKFSDSIKNIDGYAFYGCSALEDDIVIGDNILQIGNYAFANCSLIPKIEILNKDCVLGASVFKGCTAVEELIIAFVNVSSTVTESLGCASYGSGWTLTLMDGVTSVGDNAFKGVTGLISVDYSATLETIGASAFYGCTGLTELELPSTVQNIGNYAYYGCKNVAGEFVVPEACEYIGNWAFGSTAGTLGSAHYMNTPSSVQFTKLTINDRIKSIGDYAFYGCYLMAGELTFPSTLEYIGDYAFSGAYGRYGASSRYENGEYITQSSAITEVSFEDCNVTIGEGAFKECRDIITLDLGDGKSICNASCFSGCINLVTLNLGNGITDIPASMFQNCSSLTNVDLGSTLENIGASAFEGTNITGETPLPATIKTIGKRAFANLTKMTGELVFTDNLETIGERAFTGCSGITSVVLSPNAVSTGTYVFENCTGITPTITIPAGSDKISDGLFSGCTGIKEVVMNNDVTSVGAKAFKGCSSLEINISIPDTCTTIGEYAFSDCVKLSGVDFGNSLVSIGDYAFYRCYALDAIEFPDSLETIGNYAFGTKTSGDGYGNYTNAIHVQESEQMGVKSIKMSANIKNIGTGAFLGCAELEAISVPDTVESVGNSVFAYCYSLRTFDVPTIFYEQSTSCFNECDNIKTVDIPDGPTTIASSLFKGCDGLETLTISSSVKSISSNAFGGCYALKTLTLEEGLETIGSSAFKNCQSLRKIAFPNSLKTIGEAAFGGFANYNVLSGFTRYDKMYISSVSFGDSLERIETRAFSPSVVWECEITFPETIKYIGDYAFTQYDYKGQYYYSNVYASDTNDDGVPDSSAYDEKGVITSYGYGGGSTVSTGANKGTIYDSDGVAVVIPNRVTALNFTGNNLEYIGVNAFKGLSRNKSPLTLAGETLVLSEGCFEDCDSIPSISVSGATTIPNRAFNDCSSAESIVLSDSVTSIGDYAFADCESLSTPLVVPNSVTSIGTQAFYECKLLPALTLSESLVTIGEKAFSGCSSLDGELVIPDLVDTIKTEAFYDCVSLDELYLGNGIKTIGDRAFYGFAGNITNMPSEIENMGEDVFGEDAADEDGAIYIGKYLVSFDNIKGLKSYTVKDGTVTICQEAFKGENLEEVILPDSVEVIAAYAFADMTALTNIQLSQGLEKLQDHAFAGCTVLETLVLPESLSEIPAYAFEGCTNLKTLELSDSINKIGEYAFKGCASYSSPITVYEHWVVDAHAFDGCSLIPEISVLNGYQQIGTYAFANCTSAKGKIIVGEDSVFGSYCFYNCDNIEEVEIIANVPVINDYAFGSCDGFKKVSVLGKGLPLSKEGDTINLNETVILEPVVDKQTFTFTCDKTTLYYFGALSKSYYDESLSFEVYNTTDDCEVETTVISRYTNTVSPYAITFDMEKGKTYSISVQGIHFETVTNENYFKFVLRYNTNYAEFATLSSKAFTGSNNTKEFVFGNDNVTSDLVNKLNANNSVNGFNVTLLDTVKSIGESAFKDKKVLGELVIPDNCVLNSYAFANTLVESVRFGENNHGTISTHAFAGCTNLVNLGLGGIDIIDSYAFRECTSLVDLRFDGGVINDFAFANCSALETVDLNFRRYNERESGSVAWRSFENCLNIETITLNNPDYMQVIFDSWITHSSDPTDNLKVNEVNTNSLKEWLCFQFRENYNGYHKIRGGSYWSGYYTIYEGWDYCNPTWFTDNFYINGELLPEDLVVPDGVSALYSNSIYTNRTITSLYVPDSVETVGFTLSSGKATKAPFAFEVTELTSMDVPFLGTSRENGGSTVGYFLGNAPLVNELNVRSGIVNVVNNAKEVCLGEDVTIVAGAWDSLLEKLIISGDETNFANINMSNCTSLKEISLYVDEYAFSELNLTSTVEKTVSVNLLGTVVGTNFFKNRYISSVSGLENIIRFEDSAFYNCQYLTTDLIFSDEAIYFGDYAFYSCDNITTVQFGPNVKHIGRRAFMDCRNVAGVVVVPESVVYIGEYAFTNIGNLNNDVDTALCTLIANIPNCTVIGDSAFHYTKLTDLTLSSEPVSVGDNAFNDTRVDGTLIIPDGSYIGSYAFNNIPTLDEVVLGDIEYNFGVCSHKNVEFVQKGTEATCVEQGQYDIYICSACKHYLYEVDETYEKVHLIKNASSTTCETESCRTTTSDNSFVIYSENGEFVGTKYYSPHSDTDSNNLCDICERDMLGVISEDTVISGELFRYSDGTYDIATYEFIPKRSGNYSLLGELNNVSLGIVNSSSYWGYIYCCAGKKYELQITPNYGGESGTYNGKITLSNSGVSSSYKAFSGTPVTKVTLNGEFCLLGSGISGAWFGFEPYVTELVLGEKANFKNSLDESITTDGTANWSVLETIKLSQNNPYFLCSTNILYDKDCTKFVWVPAKLGGDIVVPEGITAVPVETFKGRSITSVKLASTIASIGASAFAECANLAGTIEIPLEVKVIECATFQNCSKLEILVLHNEITEVRDYAFTGCSSISNDVGFPNNLTYIGQSAFKDCSNMKGDVVVDASCTVRPSAFENCASISSINYKSEKSYVESSIFAGCSSASGSIILPDTVTKVGVSAFDGCSSITKLQLSPSLTYIGDYAFRGMSSLGSETEIIVPESCYSIGAEAFFVESCGAQIAKLYIPSTIKAITDRTFCGLNPTVIACAENHPTMKTVDGYLCNTNGKTLMLVPYTVDEVFTVPEQFTQVGPYAFAYTSKITDLTIPQTVKFVDKGAFMNMINLVNLTFEEDSVNWIEDYGFAYNAGVTNIIQLPSSLIYIGNYAFAGCSSLGWIGIPAETEIVGEGAFQDVPNATLDEANPYITIVNGEFTSADPSSFNPPYIGSESLTAVQWEISEDGKTLRISGNGKMKNWGGDLMGDGEWVDSPFIEYLATIETVIVEDGVTNIGDYAFFWADASNGITGEEVTQTTLKKVVLGKDVQEIGSGAFFGNLNIEAFEVSAENPYIVCENNILKSKDEKTVYMALQSFSGEFVGNENLETIEFAAFSFSGVSNVTLPESVKSIPLYAFAGCESLEELKMPGAVNFGAGIVMGCKNLEYVEMSSNVPLVNTSDEYAPYTFMYSMSDGIALKLVGEGDMPYFDINSMFAEDVEYAPFYMMVSSVMPIKSVEFGDGITSVTSGSFMFMGGEGGTADVLQTIKLGKNLTSLGDATFMLRNKIANIVIPEENQNFVLENGVLYNADETIPYVMTNAVSERLELADTVTTIPFGFGAMSNKISSITLGSNVESVGSMAFYYVPKLERVEVLNNNTSYDTMAFAYNSFNMFAEEGSTTEEYVTVLNEEYDSNVTFMGMCAHENKESHEAVEATCTTLGYTAGVYCSDCGYWIKGHDKIVMSHVDEDDDGVCEICGKDANDIELNIEKSFECEAYYAIEDTDPIGCYTWIKYRAPYTGTYSFEIHDEIVDSSGKPYNRSNLMILKTDDVYTMDVNDETAVQNAYVYAGYDYFLKGTAEFEAGQTYWLGVNFYYSDVSGSISVRLNYDDCIHGDCETIQEGVEPTSCSEPGMYPIILCHTCNEYIRNAEIWYEPHTDEDDDLVCDVCEEAYADIRINETLSSVSYTQEPTLYRFVAPVKGTYIITTSSSSIKKEVYDRNQTELLYEDDYSSNLECELEEGETYIVSVSSRYSTYTSNFVITIKDCLHTNTRVDEPSVDPVDCGTPGYAGIVWCSDCRVFIQNGEEVYLPHADDNSDGVCELCGSYVSDILPGQTKTITIVAGSVTYLKFIPTETASYTFTSVVGNGDTYGFLYDENKTQITYNDDGGGSSQFKITYTLEAGKTYYWGARFYSTSKSGSFDVTLTQN